MTANEIIQLAKETRDAQKRYFATRCRMDLMEARSLECDLDAAIEEYEKQQ